MRLSQHWRVGGKCAAVLVLLGCGGQAVRSEDDPEADVGGSGGSANVHESVVSTAATQATSTTETVGAVLSVVTSSTSGSSTDPGNDPLPAACVVTRNDSWDGTSCELEVDCAGTSISAECGSADGHEFGCVSSGEKWEARYDLHGVDATNACSYAIGAYLRVPAFETESYECMRILDSHDMEECNSHAGCEREAALGDVKLTASESRVTRCHAGASGWTCDCREPDFGVTFDIPSVTSMTLCLEARDWCAGESLVLSGSRTCAPTQVTAEPSSCRASLTCSQAVVASGVSATMHESVSMNCSRSSDGLYECSCLYSGNFSVAAQDSESACDAAASRCAEG